MPARRPDAPGADVFAAWLALLLGDVLAPPAHAHAHAENGGGVHVGRGDALALLVEISQPGVLTGITTREEAQRFLFLPSRIVDSVADLVDDIGDEPRPAGWPPARRRIVQQAAATGPC